MKEYLDKPRLLQFLSLTIEQYLCLEYFNNFFFIKITFECLIKQHTGGISNYYSRYENLH